MREVYAKRLEARGRRARGRGRRARRRALSERVAAAHTELKESMAGPPDTGEHEIDRTMSREPKTTLPEDLLRLAQRADREGPGRLQRPSQAEAVPREARRGRRRRTERSTGRTPSRSRSPRCSRSACRSALTGQDTERGTFSQRHLVLHDAETGERVRARSRTCAAPCRRSSCTTARCRSRPASASSTATACRTPTRSSLWEAQFGDFVNSGQVILDQFITSGWRSGARPRASRCCSRTATRARAPSTPRGRARALPPGLRRGQHARGQLHHAGPVLPPAAPPGARVQAAPARGDDAEEPAPPARPRRPRSRSCGAAASSACSTTH